MRLLSLDHSLSVPPQIPILFVFWCFVGGPSCLFLFFDFLLFRCVFWFVGLRFSSVHLVVSCELGLPPPPSRPFPFSKSPTPPYSQSNKFFDFSTMAVPRFCIPFPFLPGASPSDLGVLNSFFLGSSSSLPLSYISAYLLEVQ